MREFISIIRLWGQSIPINILGDVANFLPMSGTIYTVELNFIGDAFVISFVVITTRHGKTEATAIWNLNKETDTQKMNGRTIRKYLFLPLVAIAALSMTGCTKGSIPHRAAPLTEAASGFRWSRKACRARKSSPAPPTPRPRPSARSRSCTYFFSDRSGKYLQARQDGGGHSYQGDRQSAKGTFHAAHR